MISCDRDLFQLRLRYRFAEPFSAEKAALWAEIQEMEQGMDPNEIRAVIEAVIFAPEPAEEEQLQLPIAA